MSAGTAYDRPELRARLELRRERLRSNSVRVVIIGEVKAGKSSLVNAALEILFELVGKASIHSPAHPVCIDCDALN